MKILQKLFHLHSFDSDHLSQHLRFNLGTLQDVRYNLLSVRCGCHSPRSCRSFFHVFSSTFATSVRTDNEIRAGRDVCWFHRTCQVYKTHQFQKQRLLFIPKAALQSEPGQPQGTTALTQCTGGFTCFLLQLQIVYTFRYWWPFFRIPDIHHA